MSWDSSRRIVTQSNIWTEEQIFSDKITCSLWNHISIPLVSGKAPAVSYPEWTLVRDDGAGSTGIWAWAFDDGEYIWASVMFPHDYKNGTTIYPRLYYMCLTDVDPADNFKMGLEYCWGQEEDFPTTTSTVEQTISTGVNTAYDARESDIGTGIDGTGHEFGELFTCRLYRAAADTDNYAGGVVVSDLVINFEIDCFGTIGKSTK